MSTVSAIPVQLQLTTRSTPPVAPVDLNTLQVPRIWRGENVDFNVAIFDPAGNAVDLSNLEFLELDIFPILIPPRDVPTNQVYAPYSILPFPSTPPAPLLSVTVPAEDITALVDRADWDAGIAQQAVFSFNWSETGSLNLGGKRNKKFWISVHGLTTDGRKLTYGAGYLDVFENGEQNIYLPNTIAPLDVPEFTILYIEPNQQLVFGETISVEGMIDIEGQMVQVY